MQRTKAQIQKEFNEFAEKIARLESLKHELDALDTKGFETEVKLIRAKLKDIGEIPSISRDIAELKRKVERKYAKAVDVGSGLKRKISHLEREIEERKRIACTKQLSGKEVGDVKDIPKLEGELHRLKKSFDEHLTTRKVKIDTGVGLLVDSKFDDFIKELKADLTEKLREEEKFLKEEENLRLKSDLEKRKELFAEKGAEIENKNKNEELMLKVELGKEKQKLENKKKTVAEMLKKRQQEFSDKYAEFVRKTHENYKKKAETDLKSEIRRRFNAELKKKINVMKAKVVEETKKSALLSLMRENQKKLGFETKKTARKIGMQAKNVISNLKNKMHNEMIAKVKSEVKKREQELRRKLEREYNQKLAMESKIKQAELEKRKAQMEKFVELQAKRIFK